MSTLPLSPELKTQFDDVTTGKQQGEAIRALLVQNINGMLQLVTTEPENSTDKEDFNTVLGKLLAKDTSKPGYALYRLDSKSPAGLYEWINCAYRPEGAKVREKMQYTLTQTSLFKALDEQHFLETVYGGSVSEFAFPTRLRNQRKHDYQNPQQSIAGKKPAEAAGTGTAGRRNFEKVPVPGSLPSRQSPAVAEASPVQATEKSIARSPEAEKSGMLPEPSRLDNPPKAVVDPSPPSPHVEEHIEDQVQPLGEASVAVQESTEVDAVQRRPSNPVESSPASQGEPEKAEEQSVEDAVKDYAPLSALSALSPNAEKHEIQDDIMEQSIAPSSYSELREEAPVEERKPAESALSSTVEEPAAKSTKTETEVKPSTTSVGMGTGSRGLETESERHLANLKSEEQKMKGASGQGGSHIGFSWQEDVEPALHGLAKRLGGTSEWNLVVLKIDLSKEEIELASHPRFVPPGDFSETLSNTEPCYAFYSHPAVQTESDDSSQVVVVYVCPLHSSVRQRMLYSANLAAISNRVSEIQGLSILKRIETSDPRELTAAFFAEELLDQAPSLAGQAKILSRPKRPGRK